MIDPPKQTVLSKHRWHDLTVKGSSRLYVLVEQDEHIAEDLS